MTTYSMTGPDGKTYSIDGPAGATQEQVASQMASAHANLAAPSPGFGGTLADMARSVPGALAKEVAGLVGLPGDFKNLLDTGMNKLTGANVSTNDALSPTSATVNNTISKPFGGYYQPQTTAGDITQTIASMALNALIPGSALARAARVVVPGVTSEAAGQAAQKYEPKLEPWARAGGALLGGIGEGVGEAFATPNAAIASAPTADQLAQAKTATYDAADQAGVVIKPEAWQSFSAHLTNDLTKDGVTHPAIHPNGLSALNVVQQEAEAGAPMSLSRADLVRQAVNGAVENAATQGNQQDVALAMKVKSGLDDFLNGLTPQDTMQGDPEVAMPLLNQARDLASREFKAKQIQQMIDLAQNSASTNYSASGYEQALRAQFKNLNAQLIKNPSLANTYSQAEREAIQNVAQGGPLGNALRYVGKLAPTGVISSGMGAAMGAGAGGALGGPIGAGIGAMAVPTVGALARSGATTITQHNADLAAALMRAGQPLAQSPSLLQKSSPALLATVLSQAGANGSP